MVCGKAKAAKNVHANTFWVDPALPIIYSVFHECDQDALVLEKGFGGVPGYVGSGARGISGVFRMV